MTDHCKREIAGCEKLLIGIGEEWDAGGQPGLAEVYECLSRLVAGKDYFIITTVTDGLILEASLDTKRIVAPCGNVNWLQCSKTCTKDIWEPFEIPDGICPHCGSGLIGNTIEADNYIEEGYLPQWKAYTDWLAGTLNKKLLILELGVGFRTPTVVRWPFEKTAYFNKKARFYRINEKFAQISEEIGDKSVTMKENSVKFIKNL